MDHVAIMNKSWNLIPKILDGRKRIESRWGKNRSVPWGKIFKDDFVYFKNAGEDVIAKAKVFKVKKFESLDRETVKSILKKYGGKGGIAVNSVKETLAWTRGKKYCTLIFLKDAVAIKPFKVNKKGFGSSCAWMTVKSVSEITL